MLCRLPQTSIALIDQLREVDVSRIQTYIGSLPEEIFKPIHNCLLELFK